MVEPTSTRSAFRAIEIFQGLGETGLGEKMIQSWRELAAEFEMLGPELLGDLLQGLQMRGRITIPKRMVCDECDATLEKCAQKVEGSHDYMLLWR